MYKIKFIFLFGFFLTLSSTSYSAQENSALGNPKEKRANNGQKCVNNGQKWKLPYHQKKYCLKTSPNRQPSFVQCKASAYKPAYIRQQINICNNTPTSLLGCNNAMHIPLKIQCVPPYNYANNCPQYSKMHIIKKKKNYITVQTIDIKENNTQYKPIIAQKVHIPQQQSLQQPPPLASYEGKRPYHVFSCTSITTCEALSTVITCLQYWHICEDIGSLKQIFQYLSKPNKYRDIVYAYHHLLDRHLKGKNTQEAYDYIHKQVTKSLYCNFTTCKSYTRNQMLRRKLDVDDNKAFIFLRDLLDTIHAYLVHGYDSGHRYLVKDRDKRPKAASSDDQKEASDSVGDLFDYEMNALQAWQAPIKQQQRTKDKSDKFQTKIMQINNAQEDNNISLALLAARFSHDSTVQSWLQYLKDNECDTDNLLEQIEDNTSMIYHNITSDKVKAYIKQIQVGKKNEQHKKGLYSFGVNFYYWDYYKTSDKKDVGHHASLPYKDLYVPPAYKSLKDELLAKGMHITQWDQTIYEAKKMLQLSPVLKRLKPCLHKYNLFMKYNLKKTTRLSAHHILSVLFYTYFMSFYKDFSSSFQYLSASESLQGIIKRNAKWHFLSKYLREIVEVFGEKIGLDDKYKCVDKGFFYHGVPYMLFSNCSRVCFYGPFSTAKQLAVATLFIDNEGLVVQLQSGIRWADRFLKFFNVSLISRFAAEDERLFIGGQCPLAIASIRLLKQKINTLPLIHTLNVVAQMIVGRNLERMQVCPLDILIFKKLLSHSSDLPSYIQQTWRKFRHKQEKIKINIKYMYQHYQLFIPLLFSVDPQYKHLLLFDKLVQLFPNIKKILLEVTDNINGTWKKKNYSSSMVGVGFMSGIKDCLCSIKQNKRHMLQQITIKMYTNNIRSDFKLYATQFGVLGWYIGIGHHTIEITKHPYENCIAKLSWMVRGTHAVHEATSLDKTMLDKLVVGGNDVPPEVQKKWKLFQDRWQKVTINMRYMYKYYPLLIPLLCSSELKYKNLLLLDKIAQLFPNVTQIICTSVDNIAGGLGDEDILPAIISPNFMSGLMDMLRAMHKKTKLRKIIIKTSWTSLIKDYGCLYATQFGKLGWQLDKGDHTIILMKNLYDDFKDDFIAKISAMVGGEPPPCEITSLDIRLFDKLIAGDKNLPPHVQQIWTKFACAQQSIKINMRCMNKHYKALNPLLLSKSVKNLLLFDKLSEIFPNATEITCIKTDCILIAQSSWLEGFSSTIVDVNFVLGVQDRLRNIAKNSRNKLQAIVIKTAEYKVTVDCALYVRQFRRLGWMIHIKHREDARKFKGKIVFTKLSS